MGNKFIWAVAVITLIIACSKNSSSGSPPTPPPLNSCSNKADCLPGSWFIYSSSATLKNGLVIPLFIKSANNNLLDFEKWNWVFTADGKWTEYLHGGILNDSGRYVVNKDTVFTKGKFPHAYVIADITKSNMKGYFVFDHVKPDSLGVRTALSVNIDTANLNNLTAEWDR
jgi:hypothetical protein